MIAAVRRRRQAGNTALQIPRDFLCSIGCAETHRRRDGDLNPAGPGPLLTCAFRSNIPSRRRGTTGTRNWAASKPMPARKGLIWPSRVRAPSGKISTLHPRSIRIARKCEALAKSSMQRQRKHVVDRNDQPVGCAVSKGREKSSFLAADFASIQEALHPWRRPASDETAPATLQGRRRDRKMRCDWRQPEQVRSIPEDFLVPVMRGQPRSSIAGRASRLKTSARTIRTGQLCAQRG